MNNEEKKIYHIPVLVKEVIEQMCLKPGGVYIDATFGGGGHTRAMLEAEPNCTVIGMDWDLYALEANGGVLQQMFPSRLKLVWGNFAQVDKKIQKVNFEKVDGILADFGTSQYQLFERPGFSFYKDSPLDMRMAPAHQQTTAAHVVNNATQKELIIILKEYGEEYDALPIARMIVEERKKKPIATTAQLVAVIEKVTGPKRHFQKIHPATKTFQALRIYVNKELENIHSFLQAAMRILNPGGRLLCISFHSLEDRIVKNFFKEQVKNMPEKLFLPVEKPIVATAQEVEQNASSRSAKLRVLALR